MAYIVEANRIIGTQIVEHERDDESSVYPRLAGFLADDHGLSAMSRAHREILHLAKLLTRLTDGLRPHETDRYLIRDAQRIVESIESLVRMHNAQEEDIYQHAIADWDGEAQSVEGAQPGAISAAEPQVAAKTSRGWRTAVAALALLVAGGGALYWSLRYDHGARYITQKLDRGPVAPTVLASGAVQPIIAAEVTSHVSGAIEVLSCDAGAKVRAGQLCAKIDPRPYQDSVERAKVDLATAKARLEIDKAALVRAKAALDPNEAKAKRRTASRKALEASRKAYEQALARTSLGEASIARSQAALEASQIDLAHTDIISPIDGTVVSRAAEIGQMVEANARAPLFAIAANFAIMQVGAKVGETDIGKIKLGDKARFAIQSLPDHFFAGEVTQIRPSAPTAESGAAYDVVIAAPNPDLLLEPGMMAAITIVGERRDNVLRAPDRALRFKPEDAALPNGAVGQAPPPEGWSRVWILRDGKAMPVSVQLGLSDGVYAEIVKGDVRPGDQAILEIVDERPAPSGGAPSNR